MTGFARRGFGYSDLVIFHDYRRLSGGWSQPDVPKLIFKDAKFRSTFQHGARVMPDPWIEVVFWERPGTAIDAERHDKIREALSRLFDSPYFDELAQYGVSPPKIRGWKTVTDPAPPSGWRSKADGGWNDTLAVGDLYLSMVDRGDLPVLPSQAPDGQELLLLAILPADFDNKLRDDGGYNAHNIGAKKDSRQPIWAWLEPQSMDGFCASAAHEIIEAVTDPDLKSGYMMLKTDWHLENEEIGDLDEACVFVVDPDGAVRQVANTGYVNDVFVEGYWSEKDGANILPIDRDYRARITAVISADTETVVKDDQFTPDADTIQFCPEMAGRKFSYKIVHRPQHVKCSVETHRYHTPKPTWSVAGTEIDAARTLTLTVNAHEYVDQENFSYLPKAVTLECSLDDDSLVISCDDGVSFDLPISCTVHDDAIQGPLLVDVLASPALVLGFEGSAVELDPEYTKLFDQAVARLQKAAKEATVRYVEQPERPLPPGPIELPEGILDSVPVFAGLPGFQNAVNAMQALNAGRRVLARDEVQSLARALVKRSGALKLAQAVRLRGESSPKLTTLNLARQRKALEPLRSAEPIQHPPVSEGLAPQPVE